MSLQDLENSNQSSSDIVSDANCEVEPPSGRKRINYMTFILHARCQNATCDQSFGITNHSNSTFIFTQGILALSIEMQAGLLVQLLKCDRYNRQR
jgi:hypothetical protein